MHGKDPVAGLQLGLPHKPAPPALLGLICESSLSKTLILLGLIEGQDAIVTLQKLPFMIDDGEFFRTLGLDQIHHLDTNDVYSWNVATILQDAERNPSAKVNLIYPATQTHIKKYRAQQKRVVNETPEMYENVVAPYIQTMKGTRIQWVYNILHHGVEADRVIKRNDDPVNGFVLLPDMKWDRKDMQSLYLVAIVLRDDLASIRDLTQAHLPFLRSIKNEIQETVKEKYVLEPSQLKLYFHYQPSYYHLHIHVANVAHEQLDFGKSVLLDNVVAQLEAISPKTMKDLTLSYIIGEGHQLWQNGLRDYS
ncbi:hypothetical protein TRICI_002112 [Trichomonascus ciferrii]|uniref:m7GpppX diphosphatase n=1 Tax=Trichomonascus ciferrii TaxID=44093 RepID=A0A642VC80_9ASCO|nr:hypothetical protein TRICI_002112 [Trichomonascus ciferrii]